MSIFANLALKTASENLEIGHTATGSVAIVGQDWQQDFITDKDGISQTWQFDYTFLDTKLLFSLKSSGYLRKRLDRTLIEGTNVLDFGYLLAGDINDDGIVNNIDVAIIYQNWFGDSLGDYNKDGIVNSFDFWILVNNFFMEDE